MTEPVVLAKFRDFPGFLAALQARVAMLRTTYATLDAISGLPDGYCEKVLKKTPEKRIGPISMGPLLGTLGCELWLVEDPEQWAKVVKRMTRSKRPDPGAKLPTRAASVNRSRKQWKGNSEWGRNLRLRQLAMLTPKCRSKLSRNANKVRWKAAKRRRIRDKLVGVKS